MKKIIMEIDENLVWLTGFALFLAILVFLSIKFDVRLRQDCRICSEREEMRKMLTKPEIEVE